MARIIVGVDGSEHSLRALHFAATEAACHGASVVALAVEPYPEVVGLPGAAFPVEPHETAQKRAQAELERLLAEQADGLPDVDIEPRAIVGSPAKELLRAAADASLLVVGARGHGGFVGLLLGSVSLQCATHAPCPVVIVRGQETG